jgi:D-apionolactonase
MAEVAVASRLTGRPDPAGGLRPIDLGRLSLQLGTRDVRYVRLGADELVRRLFVAVRDVGWGTASAALEHESVDVTDTSLAAASTALCRDSEHGIELRWTEMLRCEHDGSIEFTFAGTALRGFRYGRIGLCVLHPPTFAGGRYRAKTPDGWIEGELDATIAPQLPGEHGFGEPLFPAFDELVLRRPDGAGAHLRLAGDLFEFEDQRNWGDASYKTYSTPLRIGPQVAVPGQVFEQRVEITPVATRARRRAATTTPTVELGATSSHVVPEVGTVLRELHDVGPRHRELLRALRPAHLRVDAVATDLDEALREAVEVARTVGAPLELAITHDSVPASMSVLRDVRPELARVLAFRRGVVTSVPSDLELTRRLVADSGLAAPVFGGTDVLFADLNGDRPNLAGHDGVAFPLVPTVHADDDLSLVETMEVFADIVRTARAFTRTLPLAATPITLRARPGVDARQSSLLAAVWTLGALAGLASAGTESATLFEAVGPRGLMDAEGRAWPVYHVVADVCGWRSWTVVETRVSDPLAVAALAARSPSGTVSAVVANASSRAARVRLAGVPPGARVRRLNDARYEASAVDPAGFRESGEPFEADSIELLPYELVRLDATG